MSTLVICDGCGRELGYYADEFPYREVSDLCGDCRRPEGAAEPLAGGAPNPSPVVPTDPQRKGTAADLAPADIADELSRLPSEHVEKRDELVARLRAVGGSGQLTAEQLRHERDEAQRDNAAMRDLCARLEHERLTGEEAEWTLGWLPHPPKRRPLAGKQSLDESMPAVVRAKLRAIASGEGGGDG